MATFKERIEDLIGTEMDSNSANGLGAIFDNSVRTTCKALPMQLIYEKGALAAGLLDSDPTTLNATDKFIVHVERSDEGAVKRACTVADAAFFQDAKDANSIYEATTYTPVYSITNVGGIETLEVHPVSSDAQPVNYYYIDFASIESLDAATTDSADDINLGLYASSLSGVPAIAYQAIVYKSASDYLMTYLNEAIQEDEDTEITNLINNQISALKSSYMEELQRLGVELATEVR